MKEIKNIRIKKVKPFLYVALIITALSFGKTFAYFYQQVIVPNVFKTMTYNVELKEEFEGKFGKKKVWIENNEDNGVDVVLRVNYNEVWSNDGFIFSNKVNGVNVVEKAWNEEFINNFTLLDDGWYYYNKLLKANERVHILNSIQLNIEEYADYDYDLVVNYEAIQATSDAVYEIWDKTITINGDNVIWE